MSAENEADYRPTLDEPLSRDPRRKLRRRGARSLSGTELLAVIIGGNEKTVRGLVRRHPAFRIGAPRFLVPSGLPVE